MKRANSSWLSRSPISGLPQSVRPASSSPTTRLATVGQDARYQGGNVRFKEAHILMRAIQTFAEAAYADSSAPVAGVTRQIPFPPRYRIDGLRPLQQPLSR